MNTIRPITAVITTVRPFFASFGNYLLNATKGSAMKCLYSWIVVVLIDKRCHGIGQIEANGQTKVAETFGAFRVGFN